MTFADRSRRNCKVMFELLAVVPLAACFLTAEIDRAGLEARALEKCPSQAL